MQRQTQYNSGCVTGVVYNVEYEPLRHCTERLLMCFVSLSKRLLAVASSVGQSSTALTQ